MMQPDCNDPLTGPFWQAASQERLVMSWCKSCDLAVWYPRPACPYCDKALHWEQLSGRATLFAWSVVRMPVNPELPVPYTPALVVPAEAPGVRLVSQIVDCEPEALRCDMPLSVVFRELQPKEGSSFLAPLFRPDGAA